MLQLTTDEICARLRAGGPLEAVASDTGCAIRLRSWVPHIATAIHAGSRMGAVAAPVGGHIQSTVVHWRCSVAGSGDGVLTAHGEGHVVSAGAQHLQRGRRTACTGFRQTGGHHRHADLVA